MTEILYMELPHYAASKRAAHKWLRDWRGFLPDTACVEGCVVYAAPTVQVQKAARNAEVEELRARIAELEESLKRSEESGDLLRTQLGALAERSREYEAELLYSTAHMGDLVRQVAEQQTRETQDRRRLLAQANDAARLQAELHAAREGHKATADKLAAAEKELKKLREEAAKWVVPKATRSGFAALEID